MNNYPQCYSLIEYYDDYLKHCTTQRGHGKNRYRENPYIYVFSKILQLVSENKLYVERYDKLTNSRERKRYIKLEYTDKNDKYSSKIPPEMLYIYGKYNKELINEFKKPNENRIKACQIIEDENSNLTDQIGDAIYKFYQFRRKNKKTHSLEDILDLMVFNNHSITTIFKNHAESFIEYINSDDISQLDKLNTNIMIPAFSIPTYGIVLFIKIQQHNAKKEISRNKFSLICSDPLNIISQERDRNGMIKHIYVLDEYDSNKIETIQESYEEHIYRIKSLFLSEENSKIKEIKRAVNINADILEKTTWYHFWTTLNYLSDDQKKFQQQQKAMIAQEERQERMKEEKTRRKTGLDDNLHSALAKLRG